MSKESGSSATRSLALSFYTFLSRILGLFRDHYMAVTFGSGWVASAFSIAYRLPNMYRNLLAEGTLSQSFMPIYNDAEKESAEEAAKVAGTILTFLFAMLSIFVAVFILLAPYLLPFLVGGTEEYQKLVIRLSLILFVLIMTASLSSIYIAIENVHHEYFVPSLSPIVLNLSYLFMFLFVLPSEEDMLEKIELLCFGIVGGGVLQLILQIGYVRKMGFSPKLNFNWRHSSIKKIFNLMLPAVIGGGFYQISLLFDIFLANYIQNKNPGLDAVVSLDYSQRLIQFPTGIIGVALATTTLPTLLSALKKDDRNSISPELVNVISFGIFLTFPAAIGFLIMGTSIIDSIFYGGKWTHTSTETTYGALRFYAMAIPLYSINKILTSSYYAFKDTRTPFKINMISFSINIIMNLIFMTFLKHMGLALASAISSAITCTLLFSLLKKHEIIIPVKILVKRISGFIPSLLFLSLVLVIFEFILKSSFFEYFSESGWAHASISRVFIALGISCSGIVYFIISYLMKVQEFDIIFGKITSKINRRKK